MKIANLFLVVLVGLTTNLNAQIELTEDYHYVIGDTMFLEEYTEIELTGGPSGIDRTWDFSNLDLVDPDTLYWVYSNPDELIGAFALARTRISPKSNVAAKLFDKDGVNDFIVFRYQDSTTVESYGYHYKPTNQISTQSKPNTLYSLPMSLYDELSNSFIDSFFIKDSNSDRYRFITSSEKQNDRIFDGIGTVITDQGTYTNCLRFQQLSETGASYIWVQSNFGNVIAFLLDYDDPSRKSNLQIKLNVTRTTTSIEDDKILPQPSIYLTSDRLISLTFQEGVYDYFLVDNLGRKITSGRLNQNQPRVTHDLLENINYPMGIYYLVLVNNKTGYFTSSPLKL